jgi:hypothetical protein
MDVHVQKAGRKKFTARVEDCLAGLNAEGFRGFRNLSNAPVTHAQCARWLDAVRENEARVFEKHDLADLAVPS